MTDSIPEIDALLSQLTAPAPKRRAALREHEPDAVVLAMVRTTCACCHSVAEYPSSHLLVRFGSNYKWSSRTVETSGDAPLEVRYVEVENAHCLHCFPTDATPSPDTSQRWCYGLKLAEEPTTAALPLADAMDHAAKVF